jgi:glycosyltransferase involved in cell wall biosynthesis
MPAKRNRLVCLIPHYDRPVGLAKSLASIGADEACDVLVVDDGSRREPLDEAAARAAFRARGELDILRLPQNEGIALALNAGLARAALRGYELIARLDAGDENMPGRFARQVAFLDAHPDVMLLGGAASCVDVAGVERFVLRHPTTSAEIRRALRFNSAFVHPSVMFRASALSKTGFYPPDAPTSQDYALFWEFARLFETANLPDVLIRYELDPGGMTCTHRNSQLRTRLAVQLRHRDGSLASWAGIARTLALLAVPDRLALGRRYAARRR